MGKKKNPSIFIRQKNHVVRLETLEYKKLILITNQVKDAGETNID
jgi:hypothetical protein